MLWGKAVPTLLETAKHGFVGGAAGALGFVGVAALVNYLSSREEEEKAPAYRLTEEDKDMLRAIKYEAMRKEYRRKHPKLAK